MSGRAGRRGLDTIGYSLILDSEKYPDYESINRLICDKSNTTSSQFHIDFDIIFNSIRKGMHMVDIVNQSLLTNTKQERNENIKERNNELLQQLNELPKISDCDKTISKQTNLNDLEEIEASTPIHEFVNNAKIFNELNSRIISNDLNQFLRHLKEGVIVLFTNQKYFQIGLIISIKNHNFDCNDDDDENEKVTIDIPIIITLLHSNGVKYTVKNMSDMNSVLLLTPPFKKILMDDEETIKKKFCVFYINKSKAISFTF